MLLGQTRWIGVSWDLQFENNDKRMGDIRSRVIMKLELGIYSCFWDCQHSLTPVFPEAWNFTNSFDHLKQQEGGCRRKLWLKERLLLFKCLTNMKEIRIRALWGFICHDSSVHTQIRILEWVSISSSRVSSWHRDGTRVSVSPALAGRFFTTNATSEALYSS